MQSAQRRPPGRKAGSLADAYARPLPAQRRSRWNGISCRELTLDFHRGVGRKNQVRFIHRALWKDQASPSEAVPPARRRRHQPAAVGQGTVWFGSHARHSAHRQVRRRIRVPLAWPAGDEALKRSAARPDPRRAATRPRSACSLGLARRRQQGRLAARIYMGFWRAAGITRQRPRASSVTHHRRHKAAPDDHLTASAIVPLIADLSIGSSKFSFSTEQEEFRATSPAVRRALATQVRRLMRPRPATCLRQHKLSTASRRRRCTSKTYGGQGFGFGELGIVLEGRLGRALVCAPFFSTAVLATGAILNAGTDRQTSAAAGIAAGDRDDPGLGRGSRHWDEQPRCAQPPPLGQHLDSTATKLRARRTHHRPHRLVLAPHQFPRVGRPFAVHGRRATAKPSSGGRSRPWTGRASWHAALEFRAWRRSCWARGAAPRHPARTMVEGGGLPGQRIAGVAERLRGDALAYSNCACSSARAIASFQSMKHKAADMLVDVELAKSAAYYAARRARRRRQRRRRHRGLAGKALASRSCLQTAITPSRSTAASASPGTTTPTSGSSAPRLGGAAGRRHHHREHDATGPPDGKGTSMSELNEQSVPSEGPAWLEANWDPSPRPGR